MIENRVVRMQQRMLEVMQEEMQGWVSDLLQDMLDPSKIMDFIRGIGFDLSQLPGMMSQQPGFDPYQVLGLEKSAGDQEVKQRYSELIHRLHPDKSGTPATAFLFRMVLAAYETIKRQRGWQ